MRIVAGTVATVLLIGCTTSTKDFDTLTPPPPPSAAAFAGSTPTLPAVTVAPVRTFATAPATAATAPTPGPSARPVIFVVWNGGLRAADGSIGFIVVLKDFPPSTLVALLRYRPPSGAMRTLSQVVTTRADASQTTTSVVTSGAVGDHVIDWEHPLNGRTQGQTTFTLSSTIADRAAGRTSASPCPAAPVTARFEPAQIARGGTSSLRLTGVCPGEIVTFVRILTAAGQHFGFNGDQSIALYRDTGTPWRASETYGIGVSTIYVWAKSQELRATLETR